jgi:hypothetical protein
MPIQKTNITNIPTRTIYECIVYYIEEEKKNGKKNDISIRDREPSINYSDIINNITTLLNKINYNSSSLSLPLNDYDQNIINELFIYNINNNDNYTFLRHFDKSLIKGQPKYNNIIIFINTNKTVY